MEPLNFHSPYYYLDLLLEVSSIDKAEQYSGQRTLLSAADIQIYLDNELRKTLYILTLKAPITTAADVNFLFFFFFSFLFFRENKS